MFFEEHLQELRRERFAPAALVRYARRAAARVRDDLWANPGAVRSIWGTALGFLVLAFLGSVALALRWDRALAYDVFVATALVILVTFVLVTLVVDLLRDRDGFRLSAINVPTVLTLMRACLVPAITLALVERHLALAGGLFVFAALTDVADGWIARATGQITKLGMVLDPVVDVVFNLALFAGLSAAHLLDPRVFAIAGLRYAILLVGGICLTVFVGPVRIHPTLIGRLTGVIVSGLVAFLVLIQAIGTPAARGLVPLTEIALALMLAITVAHVVVLGWYNLREMTKRPEVPGRVVGDVRWGGR